MPDSTIKIVSPDWIHLLKIFCTQCDHGAVSYLTAGRKGVRKQGTDIITSALDYLAGVANINENHWISFIIDGRAGMILVGDSLLDGGNAALERGERGKTINTLRWWIQQSWQLAGLPIRPIPASPLIVQRQQDSASCGIYAFNSIATFFKPKSHPRLALSSLRSTRARFFNNIVEYHHSVQVLCQICLNINQSLLW